MGPYEICSGFLFFFFLFYFIFSKWSVFFLFVFCVFTFNITHLNAFIHVKYNFAHKILHAIQVNSFFIDKKTQKENHPSLSKMIHPRRHPRDKLTPLPCIFSNLVSKPGTSLQQVNQSFSSFIDSFIFIT